METQTYYVVSETGDAANEYFDLADQIISEDHNIERSEDSRGLNAETHRTVTVSRVEEFERAVMSDAGVIFAQQVDSDGEPIKKLKG